MGARPLRRVIQANVEDRLSDALLGNVYKNGDLVLIDAQDGQVVLRPGDTAPENQAQSALPAS
jgi:ATP-dependent Clp protease ATP-binding subunit ClpA